MPLADSVASAKGWDNATRAIMLAGKSLPLLPEPMRQPDAYVPGCESDVWIASTVQDGKKVMAGWSPSKIIRGVLAIILEKANSLSLSERSTFDFNDYLSRCELDRYLSQSRGNGVRKVIEKLQSP